MTDKPGRKIVVTETVIDVPNSETLTAGLVGLRDRNRFLFWCLFQAVTEGTNSDDGTPRTWDEVVARACQYGRSQLAKPGEFRLLGAFCVRQLFDPSLLPQ